MALPGYNPSSTMQAVAASQAAPSVLESMLEAPEYSREALRLNDLRKLTEVQRTEVLAYLCAKYRLPKDDGLITTIVAKDGSVKPYVTAAGVFALSRDKVKSVRVEIVTSAVPTGYVVVKATATTVDGRDFEAFGCKRAVGDFHIALMQADTAARVRACKAAVGISLMTYAEAASMDEAAEEVKENTNEQR